MKLPLGAALAVTDAKLLDAAAAPPLLQVSTDTRSLEPGDAYLALRGENFDGHDFAGDAVRKGAGLLIVDNAASREPDVATMVVENTHRAYLGLARLAADMYDGWVVGITGSTGKTTTKLLLAQLCRTKLRVLESPANENNEIGVARLLLKLSNEEHDVAIVEMGARHPGDIAILEDVAQPQIGILTNVGEAHLEIMGSRQRLADTKWSLFGGGARALLNATDAVSVERAPSLPEAWTTIWYVAVPDASELEAFAHRKPLVAVAGSDRLITYGWGGAAPAEYEIATDLPGLHNRFNLAAAIAGAMALNVSPSEFIPAIPGLKLPDGRYNRVTIAGGPAVIYDAYNANASGMIAALDAFGAESAARRIAVLASMAELGEESARFHEQVGAHAAGRVDVLLVSGEFAGDLARGAQRGGMSESQVVTVDDNAQAAAWLRRHARSDDVVLLKGSRKYRLEEILRELGV